MKRAVFLHGTSGSPDDHWWPWLREIFEADGYEVWAPLLPDNDRPNRQTYADFLRSSGYDFSDVVLVGHSSGATTILNLLATEDFPNVHTAVLAGTFLNQRLTSQSADFEDDGQFEHLFPQDGFDWPMIRRHADSFYFVHSPDDPYCSYDDAMDASKQLDGTFVTIENGGHLSTRFGVTEMPALANILRLDGVLGEDH